MRLNKEKKYRLFILIVMLVILLVSLISFKLLRIHELRLEDYQLEQSKIVNKGYKYHIDDLTDNGKSINITGWLIKEETEMNIVERHLLLKDKKTGKYFKVPTEIQKRTDLSNYLDDGIDYSNSGFFAVILKKYLINSNDYEVYIADVFENGTNIVKILDSLNEE